MSREWKPGDVAWIDDTTHTTGPSLALCVRPGVVGEAKFRLPNDALVWSSTSKARPLVVIDPEDGEQVGRLERAALAVARTYLGEVS